MDAYRKRRRRKRTRRRKTRMLVIPTERRKGDLSINTKLYSGISVCGHQRWASAVGTEVGNAGLYIGTIQAAS